MSASVAAAGLGVQIDGKLILEGADLHVAPGEWLGVVGPNGSGKTTLLRCLAGRIAYQGTVTLNGADARHLSPRRRAQIVAVVPQQPVFPPGMPVADYVLLGRTPHLGRFGFEDQADRRIAAGLLDQLGLGPLATRPITTLSGGERQRAVIARALAQQPSVLLLDEPTAALDLGHQHEVLSLVDELRLDRALTVISAVHDLTLAGQYADRFLLLHRGRIMSTGSAAQVLRPALLEACYGTPVAVIEHDHTLVVVPPRPRKPSTSPTEAPEREESYRPG